MPSANNPNNTTNDVANYSDNDINLAKIAAPSVLGGVALFLGIFFAARWLFVARARERRRREKGKMKEVIPVPGLTGNDREGERKGVWGWVRRSRWKEKGDGK